MAPTDEVWSPLQDALLIEAAIKKNRVWAQVADSVFGKDWQECRERYKKLERDKVVKAANENSSRTAYRSPTKLEKTISKIVFSPTRKLDYSPAQSSLLSPNRKPKPNNNMESSQSCSKQNLSPLRKAPSSSLAAPPSKMKRSPAAVKIAQKLINNKSIISPGKKIKTQLNGSIHGSPLRMNLYEKILSPNKGSIQETNSLKVISPTKTSWIVQKEIHPLGPSLNKMKKGENFTSPSVAQRRDFPFQSMPNSKKTTPVNGKSSPKDIHTAPAPRPSPSSLLKSRSSFFDAHKTISPSIAAKKMASSQTGKSPRKPVAVKPFKRSSANFGASPNTLSSILDVNTDQDTPNCKNANRKQRYIVQDSCNDRAAPTSDIFQDFGSSRIPEEKDEKLDHSDGQEAVEENDDDEKAVDAPASTGGNFWDNLFSPNKNHRKATSPNENQPEYYDGDQLNPELFSFLEPNAAAVSGNKYHESPVPNQLGSALDDPVNLEIPRDEIEALFKDAIMGADLSEALLKEEVTSSEGEIPWVTNSSGGFSMDQVERIKEQIGQSFQLCTQMSILSRLLKNESDAFWENQMMELGNLKAKGTRKAGPKSVFNVEGVDKCRLIQREFATIREPLKISKSNVRKCVPLPDSAMRILNACTFFDSKLFPSFRPSRRTNGKSIPFSESEDGLLYQGLLAFGEHDEFSIQNHCLPGRTPASVALRIGNLTKRNMDQVRYIKEYLLLPFKPLNINEKYLLKQGIIKYGKAFRNATHILFPHMPDPFIEKAWDELYRTGQISVPWKTSFPVPKQSAALRQPNKGPYQRMALQNNMAIKAGYKENMSGPSRIPKPMPYEDEETLLEGKYNIGSPGQAAVLQERQVRGVGRARKKRNRIEKDVIDNSAVKKMRRVSVPAGDFTHPSSDANLVSIPAKKRKQKPIPKVGSVVDLFHGQ